MALSRSSQQLAGVQLRLPQADSQLRQSIKRNICKERQTLLPSSPRHAKPGRTHFASVESRASVRGPKCSAEQGGPRLRSCERHGAELGPQCSAAASLSPFSAREDCPSSITPPHASPAPTDKRFFHKLLQRALLAIPLLFLLSAFSGPAFAVQLEPPPLNTVIVPPGGGHLSLGQRIAVALRSLGLPDWVTILLIAALPVVELRGAIPVGYWFGLKPLHVYGLAVLGNMLPIPFVIAYVGKISSWLVQRSGLAKKFFDWLFARTRSRADLLVRYRTLGLTLFVAVPLPLTGAWSGAIGAHLLGLPFWESIAANLAGVMIAGAIVTALCELGYAGAVIAGAGLFTAAIAAFWTSRRKKAAGEEPLV